MEQSYVELTNNLANILYRTAAAAGKIIPRYYNLLHMLQPRLKCVLTKTDCHQFLLVLAINNSVGSGTAAFGPVTFELTALRKYK